MAGQDEVLERLRRKLEEIGGQQSEDAITRILIQVSINTAPMIPIDTGNLFNSEYRKTSKTRYGWKGEIGYGARYALPVHDAPGELKGAGILRDKNNPSRGVFWSPDAEPQFLAKGANQLVNSNQLSEIFQQSFNL